MKKQTRGAYPSPDTTLDRVLDTVSDTVLETELEKVKIRKKLPRTISTNGAHKMPYSFSSNGAEKERENHSANGFHSEYQLYRFGNQTIDISKISYEDIITEDDEPVDNFPSEKQQRLLVNPLYSSSDLERPFVAAANVGIHYLPKTPAIVPDMFLSLGSSTVDGDDIWNKENRTYYVWKMGKGPEVVLEIVSNRKGNEGEGKFETYAALGAKYYVVLDHLKQAQDEILTVYELVDGEYELRNDYLLPEVNLSLKFWDSTFEDMSWSWLRWCDLDGTMIPTADERADQAVSEAEQEKERADQAVSESDQAKAEAEQEKERADQAMSEADQAKADAEQEKERADQAMSEAEQEKERADQAASEADQAKAEAEQAKAQVERERQEKERLYALLREAGIEAGI